MYLCSALFNPPQLRAGLFKALPRNSNAHHSVGHILHNGGASGFIVHLLGHLVAQVDPANCTTRLVKPNPRMVIFEGATTI
jgi:hypothetical protein